MKGKASKSVFHAIIRIIAEWEKESHTLDYLLHRELDRIALDARDRARITDRVMNWGRWRGTARYLLDQRLKQGLDSIPPKMRRMLEECVSRLICEERVPLPVIVSEAVEEIKQGFGQTLGKMANAVLRRIAENRYDFPDADKEPLLHLSYSTSHPLWLVERWLKRWGFERTKAQLDWNNNRPVIWLRWNSLRGSFAEAPLRLQKAEIDFDEAEDYPGFFRLKSRYYPKAAELVDRGDFSVQDPSASLAVQLLNPRAGMKILDLCAAPGGKTTLMAQRSGDGAEITAVDSSAERLKMLEKALQLQGIHSVRTIVEDGTKFTRKELFDAVLVDAPCSGLGVLNRRADLRWRRQLDDFEELVPLQRKLLRNAANLVKPGGVLVYSTCTIEPEENGDVVHQFLAENTDFLLDQPPEAISEPLLFNKGKIQTHSPRDGIDGIYAAKMIRKL